MYTRLIETPIEKGSHRDGLYTHKPKGRAMSRETVLAIREGYYGGATIEQLAEEFGVSGSSIEKIIYYQRHANIMNTRY